MKRFICILAMCVVSVVCVLVVGFEAADVVAATESVMGDYGSCENHLYANNGEYTVIQEATCTSKGTKYRSCIVCEEKDIVETPKNPDNHSLVSTEITYEKMPTCVEGGVGYNICRGCNNIAKTIELDADPEAHTKNGDYVVLIAETCKADGTMAHECMYCGSYFNQQIIPSDPESHVTSEDSTWEVKVLPTCAEEGSMVCYCDLCNSVALTKAIDATGNHVPGEEWTVDVQPTCVADGVESQHCTVCDQPQNETSIPAIANNHTFSDEFTVDIAATCVSTGIKSRHCIHCDEKTDEYETSIDKNAHSYGEDWVITQESTCSEAGYKHKVCNLCNEDSVSTVIPKTEHAYSDEYEVIKESADGLSAQIKYVCMICKYENISIITYGNNSGDGNIGADTDPANKIFKLIPTETTVIKVDYENLLVSNVARNMTVADFLAKFNNSSVVVIYDVHGDIVNEEQNISTGCRINNESIEGYVTNYFVSVTGDLDSDGKVTSADARLVLRGAARVDTLSNEFFVAADVNLDGNVTSADARKTLLVSANLEYFEATYEY